MEIVRPVAQSVKSDVNALFKKNEDKEEGEVGLRGPWR